MKRSEFLRKYNRIKTYQWSCKAIENNFGVEFLELYQDFFRCSPEYCWLHVDDNGKSLQESLDMSFSKLDKEIIKPQRKKQLALFKKIILQSELYKDL